VNSFSRQSRNLIPPTPRVNEEDSVLDGLGSGSFEMLKPLFYVLH
jgi:hypothetical protein